MIEKTKRKKKRGHWCNPFTHNSQFTIHNGFKNKTPHLLQCFCYLELRGSLLDKSLFRAGYDKKKNLICERINLALTLDISSAKKKNLENRSFKVKTISSAKNKSC
jgi:hypothetical protein